MVEILNKSNWITQRLNNLKIAWGAVRGNSNYKKKETRWFSVLQE